MIIPQQTNFVGKLKENDGATMFFFLSLKSSKNYSKIFCRFINYNRIISIMGLQKVLSISNEANDSKFVTRKWNFVNNQSNANHNVGNEIISDTEIL